MEAAWNQNISIFQNQYKYICINKSKYTYFDIHQNQYILFINTTLKVILVLSSSLACYWQLMWLILFLKGVPVCLDASPSII